MDDGRSAPASAGKRAAAGADPIDDGTVRAQWRDGPDPSGPEPSDQLDRKIWRIRRRILELQGELQGAGKQHKTAMGQFEQRKRQRAAAADRQVGEVIRAAGVSEADAAQLARLVQEAGGLDALASLLGKRAAGAPPPAAERDPPAADAGGTAGAPVEPETSPPVPPPPAEPVSTTGAGPAAAAPPTVTAPKRSFGFGRR